MATDIMLDIETLTTDVPDGVILSVGAVAFNLEDVPHLEKAEQIPEECTFYTVLGVEPQLKKGRKINSGTLGWWMMQSEHARKVIIEASSRTNDWHGLHIPLVKFCEWVKYHEQSDVKTRIWAKGPDFDIVMLKDLIEEVYEEWPFFFNSSRDVRTFVDICDRLHLPRRPRGEVSHNALEDAVEQTLDIVWCWRQLEALGDG